jgi:hypothetical protein
MLHYIFIFISSATAHSCDVCSADSLRNGSASASTLHLERVMFALSQLSSQFRAKQGVNCRLSLLETTAIMEYYNQVVSPKTYVIPYSVKMFYGLGHYLRMVKAWDAEGASIADVTPGGGCDVDECIQACSVEAVRVVCSLIKCTPEALQDYVNEVKSGLPENVIFKQGGKIEKSAISSLVEDAIAAEEEEMASEKEKTKEEVDDLHLQILKSDFMYDFAEEVM